MSWLGIRESLAILKRPSTIEEIADIMWVQFVSYARKVGFIEIKKQVEFNQILKRLLDRHVEGERLGTCWINGNQFFWLEQDQWPGKVERERMARYK